MENSIILLLCKNKIRQYYRYVKSNILGSIIVAIFAAIFLPETIGLINYILENYFSIFAVIFFIYCIAKIFQDIPTINIDYRLLEFKIVGLGTLKVLILIKVLFLSVILLIFGIISNKLNYFDFRTLLILCTINANINMACFLKDQTNHKMTLSLITSLVSGIAYYLNSFSIVAISLVGLIGYFINMRFLKYDVTLQHYKSMALLQQGLVNNNVSDISNGQVNYIKENIKVSMSLMEKFYDSDKYFEHYKEISRVIFSYRKIINISVINFFIALLVRMNTVPEWGYCIALLVMIVFSENILTFLNNNEGIIIKKGFYYPYSLGKLIKNKYLIHICIISIPILSGFLIFSKINLVAVVVGIMVTPVKSIVSNYSDKFIYKCLRYLLEGAIFTACFISVI